MVITSYYTCLPWLTLSSYIYHYALYLFFVVLRYFVLCPVKRRCLVFSARFIFFSFLLFCFYDWLFFFFILFRWRALLMWCASFAFLVARFLFNFKFTTLALVAKWNARESELFAVLHVFFFFFRRRIDKKCATWESAKFACTHWCQCSLVPRTFLKPGSIAVFWHAATRPTPSSWTCTQHGFEVWRWQSWKRAR